jgi:predicted MFS family arabinose efflux permease
MSRQSPLAITGLLAVCGLVVVSQLYLPIPLLQRIAAQYNVEVSAAGLVLTVFGIAYATGFLIFGPLSDRIGRKAVMAPGLLALSIASVLVVIAPTYEILVATRIIQGFVAASLPPIALAYLGEALPERSRAFGIAGMSIAFLLAGLLGQLYGDALGSLNAAIVPLAVAYAVGGLLVWTLPEERQPRDEPLTAAYSGLPELLRNGALLRGYAAALVLLFAFVAFYTALEMFASESIEQAGLSLTAVRAAGVPAMFLPLIAAGFIRRYGPRAVVITGFGTGAVGLFAAALLANADLSVWLLVASSVVFVAGVSITVPGLIAMIGGLAPANRGLAISLYTFVLFVGASLGPQFPALLESLGLSGLCVVLGSLYMLAAFLNFSPGQPFTVTHSNLAEQSR